MRPICLSLFAIILVGCQETRTDSQSVDSQSVDLSDVSGMIKGNPQGDRGYHRSEGQASGGYSPRRKVLRDPKEDW